MADRQSDALQERLLQGVSRTFALTIPQLPEPLRRVVGNAYLLCRVADTIEDESALSSETKNRFHHRFLCLLDADDAAARTFAADLAPLLTGNSTPAEVELVSRLPEVLAVTRGLGAAQHVALRHCLTVMCEGMPRFEREASVDGLRDEQALDRYCYCVAGVVGETLTSLFAEFSGDIAVHRKQMLNLGVSFGQGLQMVNILKDFWEDRGRGVCWLPRNLFARAGVSLGKVSPGATGPAFGKVYAGLIGVAHEHLRKGLEYTLLIPAEEKGIRRFCLIALALAVQTLDSIHGQPDFANGDAVKVSRTAVAKTLMKVRVLAGRDHALRDWFADLGRRLPVMP